MPRHNRRILNNVEKNEKKLYRPSNDKAKVKIGVIAATVSFALGAGTGGIITSIRDSIREKEDIKEAVELAAKTNTVYELGQLTLDNESDVVLNTDLNYLTRLINRYSELKQVEINGELTFEEEEELINIMKQITPELVQNIKQGMLKRKIADACGIENANEINVDLRRYETPDGKQFNDYKILFDGQECRVNLKMEGLIDDAYVKETNIDSSSKQKYDESIEKMITEYNEYSETLLSGKNVFRYNNGEITFTDKSYDEKIKNTDDYDR